MWNSIAQYRDLFPFCGSRVNQLVLRLLLFLVSKSGQMSVFELVIDVP